MDVGYCTCVGVGTYDSHSYGHRLMTVCDVENCCIVICFVISLRLCV